MTVPEVYLRALGLPAEPQNQRDTLIHIAS
jgi:hypothetical protein